MNNNKSKVLLSLLAGAAAGVVAGLLLAPDSGKKSRANLMSSASKWGGDLDRVFRDGLNRLQDMTKDMTSKMGMGGQADNQGGRSGADDMFDEFSSDMDRGGEGSSANARGGRRNGSSSTGGSSMGGSSMGADQGGMGGAAGSSPS